MKNFTIHFYYTQLQCFLWSHALKVVLTGDGWGVPYTYGRWDSKTTMLLQQYLNDNMPGEDLGKGFEIPLVFLTLYLVNFDQEYFNTV